ncbi:MAG: DUF309 domain-containing protein [Candidatus Nitrosopelagicus sp.]|jgi:hypothetical protein|nr:DUF309 domain-containing protein [Candidatus Nitrosopelagicus sp.]
MERYIIHLKNNGYVSKDARKLDEQTRKLTSSINCSIQLVRIARKFVELDLFVAEKNRDELIKKLEPIGSLDNIKHVTEEEIIKEEGIKDGIFYFNNERFWECHEAFEGVWKKCSGREKTTVQGIILLAVAFGHAQRNENSTAVRMLKRVLEKIEGSLPEYHSIDIERIRKKSIQMQKENALTLFQI